MIKRIQITVATAIVLMGAATVLADKHGSDNNNDNNNNAQTRLKTQLTGASIAGQRPEGEAEFRADSPSRTRLNVEVEHVNLPAGTVLTVSVQPAGGAATAVGSITLSTFHSGELELNAEDGAAAPTVTAGEVVTVSNAGKTILAGVF